MNNTTSILVACKSQFRIMHGVPSVFSILDNSVELVSEEAVLHTVTINDDLPWVQLCEAVLDEVAMDKLEVDLIANARIWEKDIDGLVRDFIEEDLASWWHTFSPKSHEEYERNPRDDYSLDVKTATEKYKAKKYELIANAIYKELRATEET